MSSSRSRLFLKPRRPRARQPQRRHVRHLAFHRTRPARGIRFIVFEVELNQPPHFITRPAPGIERMQHRHLSLSHSLFRDAGVILAHILMPSISLISLMISYATCGTMAFPSALSLSTLRGTPSSTPRTQVLSATSGQRMSQEW